MSTPQLPKGIYTACITPFLDDGSIDLASFQSLVNTQMDHGIHGIILSGTTGESPTLSTEEKVQLLKTALKIKKEKSSKTLILIGTGTNSTKSTVDLTSRMIQEGAEGALVVTPYYNKPNQEGLVRHYDALQNMLVTTNATHFPVIVYHIPGRTSVRIEKETASKILAMTNMCGWKESTGDEENFKHLLKLRDASPLPKRIFSGDDQTFVNWSALGGDGVVSVASHLLSQEMVYSWNQVEKENSFSSLQELDKKHSSLFKDLFIEPNPSPLKFLLKEKGIIQSDFVRLPMVPCSQATKNHLKRYGS